jgi:hypothetical protein
MTEATAWRVDGHQARDDLPPPDTAIVRPLRHVRAVCERYLRRFAKPAEVASSRSARAWAWALGGAPPPLSPTARQLFHPAAPTSKPRSPPQTNDV